MQNQSTIFSTKKLNQDQRNQLLENGFDLIDYDFIKITPKPFAVGALNDYVIFTSQNTVNQVLNHESFDLIRMKPVVCVGRKTKEKLVEHSFNIIESANNAEELAEILNQKYKQSSFSFFCGESRLNILPDYFTKNEINWNEYQVYTTALTPIKISSPSPSEGGVKKFNGILFFSPTGVASYLQENTINDEVCFCIGKTTAQTLNQSTQNIQIATRATVNGVITECIKYYKNHD